MPSRRERLLDSHLAQLETTEQRAARQVAAAYGQARRELIATLVGGWNGTGVDTPDQAAARLRQLALLDQIDARVGQLERETGLILRGLLNVAAEQGVTQIRREIALLPPSLRPENTLMFATINERMVERYAPAALDGLRAGTTDLGITLRRELQTGLLQGESFPNLVGRLLRATPEGEGTAVFPRARTSAELATRRAVITAENAAKVAAIGEVATQDPLIRKQAIAVIGKGTTDCCLRVHGQIKRNDEPFELVGEPRFADRMMAPSFHWRCRTAVAMYHPAFEESMPTAKLEQDAKAEQKRRRDEKAERSRSADERAAARAARAEREAAERAAREADRERIDREAEAARIAGLSDSEARAELIDLLDRIREADDADNEALSDRLREQQRVYLRVLNERRRIEQEAERARLAVERAAREAEQARQAAQDAASLASGTVVDILEREFADVDLSIGTRGYGDLRRRATALVESQSNLSVNGKFHGMATDVQLRGLRVGNQEVYYENPVQARDFLINLYTAKRDGVVIPDTLTGANRKIIFTSQDNKDDAYWQARYTNFTRSAATGGDGTIVVYSGNSMSAGTFAHESGHNLAYKIYGNSTPPVGSAYRRAMIGEDPVSEYAKNSPSEDFAESVEEFVQNGSYMRQVAPQRYAVIEKILRDGRE